jgi:predicted membrane protein
MQVEKETGATKTSRDTYKSDDFETVSKVLKDVKASLSPDRFELLERTLKVRQMIGKVSMDVAELVHEMREHGA